MDMQARVIATVQALELLLKVNEGQVVTATVFPMLDNEHFREKVVSHFKTRGYEVVMRTDDQGSQIPEIVIARRPGGEPEEFQAQGPLMALAASMGRH